MVLDRWLFPCGSLADRPRSLTAAAEVVAAMAAEGSVAAGSAAVTGVDLVVVSEAAGSGGGGFGRRRFGAAALAPDSAAASDSVRITVGSVSAVSAGVIRLVWGMAWVTAMAIRITAWATVTAWAAMAWAATAWAATAMAIRTTDTVMGRATRVTGRDMATAPRRTGTASRPRTHPSATEQPPRRPGSVTSAAYVAPGSTAPSRPLVNGRRILGIDEEPVVLSDGRKAMKITNVYTGTGASIAGLQVGDVLISVNGYLTEQRGNLAWIIANATPGSEFKMIVHTVKDGKDHTITTTI